MRALNIKGFLSPSPLKVPDFAVMSFCLLYAVKEAKKKHSRKVDKIKIGFDKDYPASDKVWLYA